MQKILVMLRFLYYAPLQNSGIQHSTGLVIIVCFMYVYHNMTKPQIRKNLRQGDRGYDNWFISRSYGTCYLCSFG